MAVTVASLVTKMGYDDAELKAGLGAASGLVGGAMGGLTSLIEAGVVAAGAAFGAIAGSYMKVQDALTPVMTLTGANTEQFKEMSASIKDVIKSSPRSADDIGMAAYKILSSGITDTTQANLALVASNQLALAGLGSVTQASDLISSAMTVWKDSALTADQAAQTFFGTIQLGKTTTEGLAQGFGTIAPLAQIAGLSLKDLMSATAALTVTGMPAATAYTNLRNILSNIIKPTKQARGEAAQLGIDFNSAALKSEGLRAFLTDIWAKTQGDPDKIAKLFGNIRGLTGAIALMGPEADQYATDIDSIMAKGELLGQRSDEVSLTFSNRIKEMKNRVMVYLADLGQKGLDWFIGRWSIWRDTVLPMTDHFKDNIGVIFDAIKNHFLDFASGWMSSGADSPSGFFENLGSITRGVYEEMLKLFRVLKTSFLDFITGWSDGAEGSPSGFWQNFGSQAEQVGQGILDLFHDIKQGFLDFINGWESSGPDSPSGFFENLGSKAAGIRNDLLQWFANIKNAFKDFVDGFNSGTYDRPGSPAGFFQNFGDKAADAKNKVTDVFNTLQTAYKDFVTGWESGTYDRPGSPTGFFENLGHIAKIADDDIKKALEDIQQLNDMGKKDDKGERKSLVFEISVKVNDFGLWVLNQTLNDTTRAFGIVVWTANNVVLPALEGLNWFLDKTGRATVAVFYWVTGQLDDIGRKTVAVFDWLKGQLDQIGHGVVATFDWVRGQLDQIGHGVAATFQWVADQLDQIGRGAAATIIGVLNALRGLGVLVVWALSGAGTWLWNAGVALMEGFIGGIASTAARVWSAAYNAAKNAVSAVAHALINRSPSHLAREQGVFFGEGLRLGIEDMYAPVAKTAAKLASHVSSFGGVKSTTMSSHHSSTVNYGAPGSVVINMPNGSNGEDVVRALRNWSRANGKVPIAVTGRSS